MTTTRDGQSLSGSAFMAFQRAITPMMFSNCRLYSWMRLTWMSIIADGSMLMPVAFTMASASRRLLASFTTANSARNSPSSAKRCSPVRSSGSAPVVCRVPIDQPAQVRVGLQQPRARRDAVGHVAEAPREQLGESGKRLSRTSRLCSSDTPLTLRLIRTQKRPMLTRRRLAVGDDRDLIGAHVGAQAPARRPGGGRSPR